MLVIDLSFCNQPCANRVPGLSPADRFMQGDAERTRSLAVLSRRAFAASAL